MSLAWFPPSETDHDFGKRELSAYEQFLEEQRQQRELEKQVGAWLRGARTPSWL